MSRPRRPLAVETYEDRVLPSVSIASVRGFEIAPDRSAVTVVKVHVSGRDTFEAGRPVLAWTGQLFTDDGVIRLRIEIWSAAGGWGSNKFERGESLPGSARVGGSSAGAGAREIDLPSASAVSPASPGRGPVRARPDPAGGAEAMPVSLAVPGAAAPAAAPQGGTTSAAPTAGRAEILANQFIPLATTVSHVTGRMAYELIEGAVPGMGLGPDGSAVPDIPPGDAVPVPPESSEPPLAGSGIVEALSRLPLAGAVPLDLAAVGTSAAEFLDRVVGLDAEWADEALEFEDYMWTAAAVLLAGAAIHTAANRRSARAPQPFAGLDSVLAEREGDNGRRPG